MSIKPRRSALYMPASNLKAIEKARTLACDVIILDLEDAVAPEAKISARSQAVEAIKAGGFGHRELVLRVNGLDTPWGLEDMQAAAAVVPDAVLVPKVNDAAEIRRYNDHLAGSPARLQLWAMIETARSLFALYEIANPPGGSRLSCWVMGTNDLAKETGAVLTVGRTPFIGALGSAVAAARTGGLSILDGVFNDIDDDAGFATQCAQGVEFGFDGKTLIHPRQIDTCNRVFSPSEEALIWSHAVIAAFALPENADKGAIRVAGKMVERMHLFQARRTLAIAEAAGLQA